MVVLDIYQRRYMCLHLNNIYGDRAHEDKPKLSQFSVLCLIHNNVAIYNR